MRKLRLCLIACVAVLSACAAYHARPLGTGPTLLSSVPHLVASVGPLSPPGLAVHPFDPDNGLDMTEVAMLAVANNADLKAVRDERGIAEAQLLSAGILPDPQLSAGLDHPTGGPGFVNAFNVGLGYDLSALLFRSVRVKAARENSRSIDLSVLWQEWQVAQQARLLYVDSLQQQKELRERQALRDLMETLYRRVQGALQAGDVTLDAASTELISLQDASIALHDLERRMTATRHDLNALLGLSPEVRLDLVGAPDLPETDPRSIDADLAQLARRRPDLLALQAGYASQEERFRKAVLAQFPALTIGLTRSRDTSGVYTTGVGITLSLPFFDRNRGAIAVEKATREQLYDEYQARLNSAYSQVKDLLEQAALVGGQYDGVQSALPEMERTAEQAKAALDAGDLDITAYTGLQAALLSKRIEAISLEQTLLEQQVALQTLLGRELPPDLAPAAVHLDQEGS